MSWEDILKRGRVPPKPEKREIDTSWSKDGPSEKEIELRPEPTNIVEQIIRDNEEEASLAEAVRLDQKRRNRRPRSKPQNTEETNKPPKKKKNSKNPPKETRKEKKARLAAKAQNKAAEEREAQAAERRRLKRGF